MGAWTCLKNWLGGTGRVLVAAERASAKPVGEAATEAATEAAMADGAGEAKAVLRDFSALFCVVEVGDAEFLVGDLFRRRFATDSFPATPKHFVAFYKTEDGALLALGYVHFEIWEGQAMGGGLVIDERAYRRVPAADREAIRAHGGVAEAMLRASFALLPAELVAIWAYIGDALSEKVNRRVGFLPTGERHVRVIWRNEPDAAGKARCLQRVVEYGPF